MSRLRRILLAKYKEHYSQVNVSIDPRLKKPRHLRAMQLMYGELVTRLEEGSKVLDLGCGTGFLLFWLSKQKGIIPIGVDVSSSQVEFARQCLPDIEIHCVDGLNFLKSKRETFSGIFCFDVLEHIPTRDACLEWVEAARDALKPGGFVYYRVPNAANLTGCYSRCIDLSHHRIFTRPSIIQLMEAGGFSDCMIIPVRAAHLIGKIRLGIESLLHRIIYMICGRGLERVFSKDLYAVGYKDSV